MEGFCEDYGDASDEARAAGLTASAVPASRSSIPIADRVVRDGKVAVLVSSGFGAGWYSWEHDVRLLFDPQLVAAVEAGDPEALIARAEEIKPNGYWGGADDLTIRWVPVGSIFRIDEYDGSESLVLNTSDDWIAT